MLERIGIHNHMEAFLGRMLLDHLAAHLGQLALKAANTGLAGVVANDVPDSGFLELQLALLQTIGLDLLGRQIPCGNVDLLVLGIASRRMTSMRSSNGAGMFIELAVQRNITSERS